VLKAAVASTPKPPPSTPKAEGTPPPAGTQQSGRKIRTEL
jgi:hypothetical protein